MSSCYQIVANRIIEAIQERMRLPWRRPWQSAMGPSNLESRREYQGINFLLLSMTAYESPWFLTFKQAKALGGHIRKGETGFPVLFWSFIERKGEDDKTQRRIPISRLSTVFNLAQCEDIGPPKSNKPFPYPGDLKERCEQILSGYEAPPRIDETSNVASYSQLEDLVRVPPRDRFISQAEFYCTLFHELIHSTSHPSRLNRIVPRYSKSERSAYSFEELVAEFGATFLCAKTGIDSSTFDNSVAYLQGWVEGIQNRPRMLVEAAGAAQRAVNFILGTSEPREMSTLESDTLAKGNIQQELA